VILKGKVQPKQRPRFNGHAYTPKETKDYENAIRLAYLTQDKIKHAGAVKATIIYTKKNPLTRPDLDNIIKLIDALNGVAFADDNQVVEIHAYKVKGDECLEIKIEGVKI